MAVRTIRARPSFFTTKVSVKDDFPAKRIDKIMRFNANPRQRSTASRMVNEGAHSVVRIAQEIAHAEFKPRSGGRRPRPGTLHYVTSFFTEEATQDSIGRLVAKFGNRHPAATIIEFGARRHYIVQHERLLVFPFKKGATRTQPGRGVGAGVVGNWPTEFQTPGATTARKQVVDHPGSPAFHIIGRARTAYLSRVRR